MGDVWKSSRAHGRSDDSGVGDKVLAGIGDGADLINGAGVATGAGRVGVNS